MGPRLSAFASLVIFTSLFLAINSFRILFLHIYHNFSRTIMNCDKFIITADATDRQIC